MLCLCKYNAMFHNWKAKYDVDLTKSAATARITPVFNHRRSSQKAEFRAIKGS